MRRIVLVMTLASVLLGFCLADASDKDKEMFRQFDRWIKIWKTEYAETLIPGKLSKQGVYQRFGQPLSAQRSAFLYSHNGSVNQSVYSVVFSFYGDDIWVVAMNVRENARWGKKMRFLSPRVAVPDAFLDAKPIPGYRVTGFVQQVVPGHYYPEVGATAQMLGPGSWLPYEQVVSYSRTNPGGPSERNNFIWVKIRFYLPSSRKGTAFNPKTLRDEEKIDFYGWKDQAQLQSITITGSEWGR
jgi:hypothetical protein